MSEQAQLFPLTAEEYRERTKTLVALMNELEETEAAKRAAMTEFGQQMKALTREITKLRQVLMAEQEWREPQLDLVTRVVTRAADMINAGALETDVRATAWAGTAR